ncbi:hypothetical protein [Marinobacter sp. F3R08]|uniref:hypothetical protein n=1 Tax=Marinobacter sp. F3R08 TaxID=2841559 RepID=UPI001C08BD82|nr:hypothetical protein [Marinobacter sp. F3R08]MBU2952324.1 hypothetical protein [Marinobacter sp. F3R08]
MKKVLKFVGYTALVLLVIPVVMVVVGIAGNLLGENDFSKVGAFAIVGMMVIFVLMVVRLAKSRPNPSGSVDDDNPHARPELKCYFQKGFEPSIDGTGLRVDGLPE